MNSLSQIRNVAILGSTGSIGRAALDVLKYQPSSFRLTAISCHHSLDALKSQVSQFLPRYAIVTGNSHDPSQWSNASTEYTKCLSGMDRVVSLIQSDEVDIVVGAIVGVAGLESSLAAAQAGKRLALANKESLVVAGSLLTESAKKNGAELLPVDSEHSAIFQCIQAGTSPRDVERLILTASGGPLRDWPIEKLSSATVEDALAHPTWNMGKKITVDSATMMNKALEVIEARWLFGLPAERITVVVHPQSVIHSMVEFRDGSVVGQFSPPDMKLPIQYALTYPERLPSPSPKMDWSQPMCLDWKPVDMERYPAIELGYEVAKHAGTCGAVLNAANEVAVELFLEHKIKLTEIATICRQVLQHHDYSSSPSLAELFDVDRWARDEVKRRINARC